jgi:hypothetical protein
MMPRPTRGQPLSAGFRSNAGPPPRPGDREGLKTGHAVPAQPKLQVQAISDAYRLRPGRGCAAVGPLNANRVYLVTAVLPTPHVPSQMPTPTPPAVSGTDRDRGSCGSAAPESSARPGRPAHRSVAAARAHLRARSGITGTVEDCGQAVGRHVVLLFPKYPPPEQTSIQGAHRHPGPGPARLRTCTPVRI